MVVLELVLGIIIGPQVLGLAEPDEFIDFFSNLGLGMLFFFAGYEIEFERIRGAAAASRLRRLGHLAGSGLHAGRPARRRRAWCISGIFVGHRDGHHRHRHADPDPHRRRRAAHALRQLPARRRARRPSSFPIVLTTVLFSTKGALTNALLLLAFVALAVVAAVIAVRGSAAARTCSSAALETSGQLAGARRAVLAVFGLGALAAELGLELLLGGFVAGVITRLGSARARRCRSSSPS